MMKYLRRTLALSLVCVMLLASSCGRKVRFRKRAAPTNDVSSEEVSSQYVPGHRFDRDDCVVKGVKPGMTMDEVKEILGDPELQYNVDASELLDAYIGMEYPGMTINFDKDPDGEYRLSCIYIREDGISLPNGLHIGNTLYEAVSLFDNPKNITFKEDSKFFDEVFLVYDSGDLIPGIFDSDWPDEPVQVGYCSDFRKEYAPLMYVYCDPPEWNKDRTGYNLTTYTLYIRNNPGEDRITQIDIEKRTRKLTQGD